MNKTMHLGAIGLLVSVWVGQGYAEESEDWILQDDIVSVRKREELNQTAPVTANIILKNEIETLLRGSLEELEGMSPNLVIDSLNGTPQGAAIAIRGIGSADSSKSSDPTVGLFIDGVYIGNNTSRMLDVFDFERVTIDKGPQGTLHGRNTAGGAIHIERTRPTGKTGVRIQFQAATFDRQQIAAVFNVPLVQDKLAGKFTVNNIEKGGSYLSNCKLEKVDPGESDDVQYICSNRNENDREYVSLTGSLLWTPTENMSLYYIYQNEADDSLTRGLLNLSEQTDLLCSNSVVRSDEDIDDLLEVDEFCRSDLGITVPQTQDIDIVDQNFANRSRLDGGYHTLEFDWSFGSHRLTSIAAFRTQDDLVYQDLDATHSNFFSTIRGQDYDQTSWEVRLLSQASEKLQTLVGMSYFKSNYSLQRENKFLLQTLANSKLIALGELTLSDIQDDPVRLQTFTELIAERELEEGRELTGDDVVFNGSLDFDDPIITIDESQYQVTAQSKSSLSFFFHLSYILNEQWTVDIGMRHSKDLVSIVHQPGGTKLPAKITLTDPLSAEQQWNEISPKFGLQYKIDDNAMLYTIYSQGYRGGGYNENAVSINSLRDYGPETVTNYEVGLKTQWFNDRLRVNVSGFQTKYKDKQETVLTTVDTVPGLVDKFDENYDLTTLADGTVVQESWNDVPIRELVTDNLAGASVNGIELDIRAIPMERLQLRAVYGHLGSEFTRFNVDSHEPPRFNSTSGDLVTPGNSFESIDGIEVLRAPENTFSLSASYYWNWAAGRILANTTYQWTGDYSTTRSNINYGEVVTDSEDISSYVAAAREPITIGKVNGHGIWNVSIAYVWQDWTFRIFSRNLNTKRYLQNAASISSDDVVITGPDGEPTALFTNSQYNEPRYSGIEITYQPEF